MTPLNVKDKGAVPPEAVSVTVALPPLQLIAVVTAAEPVSTAGSVTSSDPVKGPQPFASVILHTYPVLAVIPVKIPVVLLTPLNV